MTKKFETWTHNGIKMLAVPNGTSVSIIDEDGGNYGSWLAVADFRKRQTTGDPITLPLTGTIGNVRFFNSAE